MKSVMKLKTAVKALVGLVSVCALFGSLSFASALPQKNEKERERGSENKGGNRGGQKEAAPARSAPAARPAAPAAPARQPASEPPPRQAAPPPSNQPREGGASTGRPGGDVNVGRGQANTGTGAGANSGRPGGDVNVGRGQANTGNGGNTARPGGEVNTGRPGGDVNVRGQANTGGGGNQGGRAQGNNEGGRGPSNNAEGGRGQGNAGRGAVTTSGRPASGFGPTRTVTARGGFTGRVDNSGRVTTIRGNGLVVNRGVHGERTIITTRNDRTRIVTVGPRRGFVDRPVIRNGRPFVTRTYVVNGRSYAHVYVGVPYRGGVYYRYVPPVFYAPGFYVWVGRPWAAPISFSWGWGPWYGYYGYYFRPYPVYADASLWLTDYIIAQNLQASYEAQQAAAAQGYGYPAPPPDPGYAATPLSPELKQAIDAEVRAELARESSAVSNPQVYTSGAGPGADQAPDALSPNFRTFIVSTPLNQQLGDGSECPLSAGDVLTRISDTPDQDGNVRVLVSSSQRNDCSSGTQFSIAVQDLQDMHNAFREHIDAGLGQLSQNQGKNGLPTGPPPAPTPYTEGTAQPDPAAEADLQAQQQAAQQAEQDVQNAAR